LITTVLADFSAALPYGGRLAGLDVGSKTIGVALCDAQWTIATAAETIKRTKFTADAEALRRLTQAQQVAGLIIGLPLSLDGRDSPQTQSVRAFARNIGQRLELPILLWDERWSTQAVTRSLIAADTRRKRRGELVDKLAAAYILQGAIDALANSAATERP
jgi:putative Holliday junction resolvase